METITITAPSFRATRAFVKANCSEVKTSNAKIEGFLGDYRVVGIPIANVNVDSVNEIYFQDAEKDLFDLTEEQKIINKKIDLDWLENFKYINE